MQLVIEPDRRRIRAAGTQRRKLRMSGAQTLDVPGHLRFPALHFQVRVTSRARLLTSKGEALRPLVLEMTFSACGSESLPLVVHGPVVTQIAGRIGNGFRKRPALHVTC